MRLFCNAIRSFVADESGPTAVEYAVMLALIIVVCITVVGSLGKSSSATFNTVQKHIASSS